MAASWRHWGEIQARGPRWIKRNPPVEASGYLCFAVVAFKGSPSRQTRRELCRGRHGCEHEIGVECPLRELVRGRLATQRSAARVVAIECTARFATGRLSCRGLGQGNGDRPDDRNGGGASSDLGIPGRHPGKHRVIFERGALHSGPPANQIMGSGLGLPRGKAASITAISLSVNCSAAAAAFSSMCATRLAFGIANTFGLRSRYASAT